MSNITILVPALGDKYIDYRDGVWGDSYTWDFPRTVDEVKYLCVHHSVTNPTGNWKEEVDHIASLHKVRGWKGIGYHFVVASDGTVAYVGDVGMARANVLGKNELVIGICFVGDFTKHLPTDAQINSGHVLLQFFLDLKVFPNLDGWEDVLGHKQLQATACPGSNWQGVPDSFYERLKNNIPYTPPVTNPPTTTTLSSSSSSTTTVSSISSTTVPPVPQDPCKVVLASLGAVLEGKGFWWTKYKKYQTIIKNSKHLWK